MPYKKLFNEYSMFIWCSFFLLKNQVKKQFKTKGDNKMIKSTHDSTLRAAARCRGFLLEKQRGNRCPELHNQYLIRDAFSGTVIAGDKYQLTAAEVRDFLNKF